MEHRSFDDRATESQNLLQSLRAMPYLDILDSSQEESATNYHQYETPESEYEQLDDIAAVRRESLPAPPVYDPLRL